MTIENLSIAALPPLAPPDQNDPEAQLVLYNRARQALKEARDFDEVREIRNKTLALGLYAKQAKDTEMCCWVSDIKMRAERRCGEMLDQAFRDGDRARDGRPHKKQSSDGTVSKPTLSEIGINKNQSSRWQRLADIPDEIFEEAMQREKDQNAIPTTEGVLRAAQYLCELKEQPASVIEKPPGPTREQLRQASREIKKANKEREKTDPQWIAWKAWAPVLTPALLFSEGIDNLSSELPALPDYDRAKLSVALRKIAAFIESFENDSPAQN